MSERSVSLRWSIAAVVLAAVATYANSLLNGFALDDEPIILGNARVHQLADQAAIWLTPYWPEHGSRAGLYRPLSIFAYALQWSAGNGAPWVFHLVSLLLHAAVCVLVFLLLRRIVHVVAALAGALIFAVHPVHTEAVANVVGQAELIAAAMVLAGCVLYIGRPAVRAELWRTVAILLLFMLALLAKESAIVLPALLLTLDLAARRLQPNRASLGAYARGATPLFVLLAVTAVAWFALRANVLGSLTGTDPAPYLPFLQDSPGQRLLTALRVWPEYLRLLAWPLDLSADYSPAVVVPPLGITAGVLAGTALLLATIVLTAALPWRTHGLAAAWFLIAILPVSNLIVPIGVILAERTLYLPSLAVAVAAAQVLANANVSRAKPLALAGVGVLLLLAGRSAARNPAWKDTSSYWQALIRDHPESYRAQRGAGELMFSRGDLAQARKYLELAYDTWPWDADLVSGLGALYLRTGEPERAIERMERARALGDTSLQTQRNLVVAYLAAKQYAEALSLAEALGRDGGANPLRAHALDGLGRHADAATQWEAVVAAEPSGWLSWMHLARARAKAGDVNGALQAADTGYGRASDEATRAATDSVRQLITLGCYASPPMSRGSSGSSCNDPIHPRGFVVTAGNANAKGIATAAGIAAQTNGYPRR